MQARVKLAYVFLMLFGGILIVRLFFLQVANRNYYKNLADRQYLNTASSEFSRGSIFFTERGGRLISAASLKRGHFLAMNPKMIESPEETFKKISAILPQLDREDFLRKAGKKSDPYEEIAHYLNQDEADKIKNFSLAGIDIYPEAWRFYPGGDLASQVLGFIGFEGNGLAGKYGLEKKYESTLARREVGGRNTNSFFEIFIEAKKKIWSSDGEEGDLVLTIDPQAQLFLDKQIQELLRSYSAESAGGIILEPLSGKILAMSGKPDFNPNDYKSVKDLSTFLNPNVQSVFEMGSIAKPLTLAAALNEGKIIPETTYYDEGSLTINSRKISNFDGKARGTVDMQEVLNQSINTGAVFAMRSLGKEKFRDYMFSYGFGERTGIDLPDEVSGLVTNLNSPREVEYATASFGQGIAVSPIQMATALASLGNGGVLMKPYVVEKIEVPGGKDIVTVPEERHRVIKEETSKIITKMLVTVVDKALLGGTVKLDHYSVAAKTGTAQIREAGGKGYYEDLYFHTFFGYAPAMNPKFLVFLYVNKPLGVNFASHSLTNPFIKIVKFLINYYEIPPDR